MEFLVKLSNWVQKRRLDGLLEIPLNNVTISRDWKIATIVPIYKGISIGNLKLLTNTFNFCGPQATGTRYSRVFEVRLG